MDQGAEQDPDTSLAGNDSTETVTPGRPAQSATPGEVARAALRQGYAANPVTVDLGGEDSDDDGPRGTRELRETIRTQVTRAAHLAPLPRYFKKIVSRYALIPGVVGQFEEALESLNDVAETTYAQLAIADRRRLLGPGWHEPLVMLVNQDFARFGEGQRAFKHVTAWLRHAVGYLESLLEMPDAHDYEQPPPPLDLELRGHFNNFAEATMQGILQHPERPNSGDASPSPSQLGDPADVSRQPWKVKDTVAAAKILMSPDLNSFYNAPLKKDARRKTSARNPLDFSRLDPMAGLLSPLPRNPTSVPKEYQSMSDALARMRAKPAQLSQNPAMTTFLAQDPAFLTPDRPARAASRASAKGSPARGTRSYPAQQGAGDPDDDGEDDDDDEGSARRPDPRGNRDYRSQSRQGRAGGRGEPPDEEYEDDGGGDDDPDGDPFTVPDPKRPKRPGLVLDMRVKLDLLPAWNGSDDTALSYMSQLNEWVRADRSGELFYQIPFAAPMRWTGIARTWWGNLTPGLRDHLSQGFHLFIPGIREHFLTQRWAEARRAEFVAMEFRQRGHEKETPFDYVNRRLFLARVLFDMTQKQLVSEVLANTPQQWAYVIGDHNLKSTDEMMKRFKQLGPSLTSAYLTGETPDAATTKAQVEELVDARVDAWMRKHGTTQTVARQPVSNNPFRAPPPAKPYNASARIAEQDAPDLGVAGFGLDDSPATTPELTGAHSALLNSAFAYLSSGAKQRPRPVDGYHFKESDVVSKRPPPSPCKVCGSDAHWDRDCGHYQSYLLRRQQNAMLASARSDEEERMYNAIYSVYANESAFSSYALGPEELEALAVPSASTSMLVESNNAGATKTDRGIPVSQNSEDRAYRTALEEVEDEDGTFCKTQTAALGLSILEDVEEPPPIDEPPTLLAVEDSDDEDEEFELQESLQRALFAQAMAASARIAEEAGPPPHDLPHRDPNLPASECVLRMPKKREHPPGLSSRGISVLSCRGRVGSLEERVITVRLDSCADLCLVHKKFLDSMKHPPRVRQGLKVQIAQLTNNAPEIEGYVVMPMFIRGEDGAVLEFDLEAYVVPEMTVDLLVGEDWHVNYEVDILRSVKNGTRVRVGDTGYCFPATSMTKETLRAEKEVKTVDARAVRVVHGHLAHFVRAKSHRRAKATRRRKRAAARNGELRAFRDVVLPAETTVLVDFAGTLAPEREWFVERNLIRVERDVFLSVPNSLISTQTDPVNEGEATLERRHAIAVTNPTSRPCMLRAGTVLGYAKDPGAALDTPRDAEDLEAKIATARALAALLQELDTRTTEEKQSHAFACRRGPEPETADPGASAPDRAPSSSSCDPAEETELPPPARAEAPDPDDLASADLEKILDVSPDAPDDVRQATLELLRKHVLAFGFDGRLGQLQTNARVRTKEGTDPIAVPMHGASPEKRQVIEEQLKKWLALDVIEDSISPWAAPVVIVYRNNKPRFCVDYRRLNAVTIADEFPIPRQADILSALSGAQVLSSLDALAGFNQMEIAPEDVEKTAFRTHMGLFQFKRMPFGLRNGPAIFQRVMQSILAPFLWLFTLVYIDDIVVYSATYGEHLVHLDKVLSAVERAGLTLSPSKCHFCYSSILLLGHKVSRLGLSTHEEKVAAIAALEPPRKLSTLQTFLGMVVYFQAFIPYYSFVVGPLFKLLRKDVPWRWTDVEQHAFEQAKTALQSAPVLGHPIRHRPYRLYTDASDEALGACLQQVQPITVADLKGTPVYERLRKAYEAKDPVPQLCIKLSAKIDDVPAPGTWGASLDATVVYVERVICYWSRTFKDAERNYSATEREGLAAKESLIKFQPFIEGEQVILVTDHAALQWARTWEHTNRRLAAWGAVFAAFTGLEIVHRAGRLHSNVDPLSRLPRSPPDFIAPAKDPTTAIRTNVDAAEILERVAGNAPAARMGATVVALWPEDVIEPAREDCEVLAVQTRRQKRLEAKRQSAQADVPAARLESSSSDAREAVLDVEGAPQPEERERTRHRPDQEILGARYEDKLEWQAANPPPTLLITMHPKLKERYCEGYAKDLAFKGKGHNSDERSWYAGNRFYKGADGLLFFRDADFMPRLCVPRSEQAPLMRHLHESAFESAHAGAEKLYSMMSSQYYWPRMRKDLLAFCSSCDVCQKNKAEANSKHGLLQPHIIPELPYERISLDLITGLPWSGLYNAILVVVDLLTKHAQFIPTDTGLDTTGFARLFVNEVVCRFGLPKEFIADRDGRWLSKFFDAVTKQMRVHMLLSSSHHPQHDGQTERTNRTLETMLRHYVSQTPQDWDQWLPSLEFAYNATTHKSTRLSPYLALYGYQPVSPATFVSHASERGIARHLTAHKDADDFLLAISNHRQAARDAIAAAQHQQAQAYNVGRHDFALEPGELVLIKPQSLELVETKGEGAKLVQRAFGPFTVQERVSDATYRINIPANIPMSNVIHARHLKKYTPSPERFGSRTTLPNPGWEDFEAERYEVEKLVAHRRNRTKKQVEYLTRWVGYGPEHDSWLTARELHDAPAVLLDYRRAHHL